MSALLCPQAGSNNLEHGGVKSANRGPAFIRPRASPTKPKPSPRFSPYHLALAEAAAGQVVVAGIARSGSGPSLAGSAESDTASPSSQQTYSAFAAHSGHSIGTLDAFTLGGAFRAQPALTAAAAAGLPTSLLYGTSLSASYSPSGSSLAGFMQGSCKQEAAVDANNMYGSYTGAYHITGYTAVPVLSSSSGASGTVSPPAVALDDAAARQPSRLAVAGHPGDMSDYGCAGRVDSSISYAPQQYQHQQPVLQFTGQQQEQLATGDCGHADHQAGLPQFIAVGSLDHLPSLPEPAEQDMLEGGDADGPSLRGIFSSDDGEPHTIQQQQPGLPELSKLGSGNQQQQQHGLHLPGIDLAAAAAVSGSQDGSPMALHQLQQVGAGSIPSPGSFTSSGDSPLQQHFQQHAAGQQMQGLHHQPPSGQHCALPALYAGALVAHGEGHTATTPCTAGYTTSSNEQEQHQQALIAQAGLAEGGQDAHHCEQQQQQVYAVLPDQQQLSTGRYTPFGHPQNQQQHMHHIYSNASYQQYGQQQQQQSQVLCEYQPYRHNVTMDGFDSGKSSHLDTLHSPTTMAQSAVAAVARLAQAGGWSATPTSGEVKQKLGMLCQQQHKQQQQPADILQLLPRTPSVDFHEELGPLADLLGDNSGEGDDHGCDATLDEDLLAAAVHASGAFGHHGDHHHISDLDLLPGLTRQNSELEMIATATCW